MKSPYLAAWTAGALFVAAGAFAVDWNNPQSVAAAALAASPSLRQSEAQLSAARARQRAAGATPNPMLMAGVQDQQIDLSSDPMMTIYMVGASQTFIRKGRRDALQRGAALDVQRVEQETESRRAEIRRDTLVAWNEAAAAANQIAANEEIARLAGMIQDAARIRYETGAAAQIDIIRAKLEQSNVRHVVLMQRGARNEAVGRLRALLGLEAGEEIPSFSLPQAMEHHAHTADVSLSATTPAISALQTEVARADEDVRLARLANRPDLNIEASYGFRPQQKDVFSILARIELPIRKATTIEPRIAEAVARRDAARAEIDVLRQQLERDFGVALAQRNEAVEQIDLHVEELVPEARLGFQSALTSYQNGQTTFDAVLGALQTYRTLNVDYFDFLRQFLVADAEIDAIQHGATGSATLSTMAGVR